MNHTNTSAGEDGFPALLVILATLIGGLVWVCVMLASVPQY